MREPVARPQARRRTRRAITSTPLRLLRRIIEENNFAAFNSVPLSVLNEEEQEIYAFVARHYARLQQFPTAITLEERRINLPEAPEPLLYYRDVLQNQIRIRQGADVVMQLQEALQADDGEAVAEIIMQRREEAVASTLTVLSLADMQTVFLNTLQPANSMRAIVGTGVPAIDDEVGGLRRGDLGVLAARPGIGKTFVQIAGAMHKCLSGERVLYISKEMTEEQVAHRLLSLYYGLDPSIGLQRRVSTMAYEEVIARLQDGLPSALVSNFIMPNSEDIRTTADVSSAIRQHQPDLCDVDGTYFIAPADKRIYTSRTERLEQIIREFREVAFSTRTATFMTWQQNRSKVVGTEGLYGTDALSQDAALVLILRKHREVRDMRIATVTKNRHGPEDIEVGLSYRFKPTNIGLRVPVPSREAQVRQGRDDFIARTVQQQPGTRPRTLEVPE